MDKRKRIINIVIFLILIMALVFGVYWLVSRKAAQKNGTPPATFRQFLGFDTQTPPAPGENGGELSSNFTSTGQSAGTGDTGASASSTTGTTASQFTNDTLSPAGNGGFTSGGSTGAGSPSGSGSGAGSTTGSAGTSTALTGAPASAGGTVAGSVCTTADVNITFTPEELARLQALQERFYAIAQTLHTDADAATELANYDDFKLKQQKLNELLAFCSAAAPQITNPDFQTRVPTPFWYETKDIRPNGNIQYMIDPAHPLQPVATNGNDVPLGYLGQPGQIGGVTKSVYDSDALANALRSIEQVLRLNLW